MDQVAVAVTVLLTVVFGAAAAGKLRSRPDFAAFVRSVPAFGVRRSWARPVAIGTVAAEVSVAALLICSPLTGSALVGQWLSVAVLTGLTAGVLHAIGRGTDARCRCFGRTEVRLSARHGWRNGSLLLLAIVAAVIDPDLSALSAEQWAVTLAVGGLLSAGYLRLDDLAALFATAKPPPARLGEGVD